MTRLSIRGTSFMPSQAALQLMLEIHQMVNDCGDNCHLTPNEVAQAIQLKIEAMEANTRVRPGKIWLGCSFSYNAFSDSIIWVMYGPKTLLASIKISPLERKEPEFEKIDLFVGPAMSGKTRKAHELYDGTPSLWIDGRTAFKKPLRKILSTVLPHEERIIIDDLPLAKLKSDIYTLSDMKLEIPFREWTYVIQRPKIVITCDCSVDQLPTTESFTRRTNVRVFPQEADHLDF